MKIRTNFVSNSSSSSFICFVDKNAWHKAFDNWSPNSHDIENLYVYHGIEGIQSVDDVKQWIYDKFEEYTFTENVFGASLYGYVFTSDRDELDNTVEEQVLRNYIDKIAKDIPAESKIVYWE